MDVEPIDESSMARVEVQALLGDGRVVPALILMGKQPGYLAVVRVWVEGVPPADARESDYFEALRTARRQLDPYGVRLLVNGARRDVWASGMAREMSRGMRIYLIERGKPAEHVVDLLAPCDASLVGTVQEQDDYYWRRT